jgi:hypothetical protein
VPITPDVSRLSVAVLAAFCVCLASACGGGGAEGDSRAAEPAPRAEQPEPADRLVEHAVESAGFALSVPSGWKTISADDALEEGTLVRLLADNPDLETYRDVFEDPSSSFKFVAADPAAKDGFATNVNVVVTSVPASVTPEQYADAIGSEIASLASVEGEVSQAQTFLPAGPAQRLEYGMRLAYAGSEQTVATTQYGLLVDGKSYVVTFATLPELAGDYAARFAEIARSLRLTSA